jgi:DNA-binding beta-propeller fold protein YncE
VLGLAVVLLGTGSAPAQDRAGGTALAQFRDAQALAVDPMGRLYVADAGRDVVRVLDRTGTELETFGGGGTRAGEFDRPADVDPTNGQAIWVADAGNGRVQRFSEEGLYLEAFPVGSSFREGREQRVFDDGRDGSAVQGQGRPIAVASSSGDETFVIDDRNSAVLKWDAQRRPERILGPAGRGDGGLRRPVALALDGTRRLYVADRDQEAVLAFDLFGSFLKRLSTPSLPEVQALSLHRGRLWIVCPGRVFVWSPETGATAEHAVDRPAPLVDAVRRGEDLFLLTETHLYRRSPW